MWRIPRRSLPHALAFAAVKAVATSAVLLGAYVGFSVHADLSDLSEGRRTPAPTVVSDQLLLPGHACAPAGLRSRPDRDASAGHLPLCPAR